MKISPKRRKYLQDDIWELRVNAVEGIARALYVAEGKNLTVLVVFVKKTERTPRAMIKLAVKRNREV